MAPRYCGTPIQLYPDTVVPRHCHTQVPWYCGAQWYSWYQVPIGTHANQWYLQHPVVPAVPCYHGTQVLWFPGTMVPRYCLTQQHPLVSALHRYHGTQVLWYQGIVVSRYCGTQVPWYLGTMVPWYPVITWHHGSEVFWYPCTEICRFHSTQVW